MRGNILKYLRQLFVILLICFVGELLHRLLKLPIPGNVLGMIILFLLLCTGVIKIEMIEDISRFLLDHLAFFFIPAGVGLIACLGILEKNWLPLLSICLIITVVVMVITGHTVQLFKRGRSK